MLCRLARPRPCPAPSALRPMDGYESSCVMGQCYGAGGGGPDGGVQAWMCWSATGGGVQAWERGGVGGWVGELLRRREF